MVLVKYLQAEPEGGHDAQSRSEIADALPRFSLVSTNMCTFGVHMYMYLFYSVYFYLMKE